MAIQLTPDVVTASTIGYYDRRLRDQCYISITTLVYIWSTMRLRGKQYRWARRIVKRARRQGWFEKIV